VVCTGASVVALSSSGNARPKHLLLTFYVLSRAMNLPAMVCLGKALVCTGASACLGKAVVCTGALACGGWSVVWSKRLGRVRRLPGFEPPALACLGKALVCTGASACLGKAVVCTGVLACGDGLGGWRTSPAVFSL